VAPSPHDTGPLGIALIKEYEGFSRIPYKCPGGVWTIGYGSTTDANGKPVTCNAPDLSEENAEAMLMRDVWNAEEAVREYVSVPLCSSQFDALVSFTYNVGQGNFKFSSLLRILNTGNYNLASLEFTKWKYAGGKVLAGLERRRKAECSLFRLGPLSSLGE
jgi:lysozyme